MAKEWCDKDPADNKILQLLPQRPKSPKKRQETIPYDDVPAALITIRGSLATDLTKLAIEFLTLTAARSAVVREAQWSEIDLTRKRWTIPLGRMKARREHRVPLTDRMIAILQEAAELHPPGGLIFPNLNTGRPFSDATFSKLFRELEIGSVPHRLRASFKDWTMEQPNADHIMA